VSIDFRGRSDFFSVHFNFITYCCLRAFCNICACIHDKACNYFAMKRPHINVVVTCAARKAEPASALARVKNLKKRTLKGRFTEWSMRMSRNRENMVKAIDLYRGNSWSIIRKLQKDRKHGKIIRLWIISAGHGLISADTLVAPYAATFADGHADSVKPFRPQSTTAGDWWKKLIQWRRQARHKVSSISEIAKSYPDEPMVIAISKEYLSATYDDIVEARKLLPSPDKIVIICTGAKKNGDLADNFLPCDARFENHFHCCRGDLNAYLLESVVKSHAASEISASKLKASFKRKLEKLPKVTLQNRSRLLDRDLEAFIALNLLDGGGGSHTNLLRLLRSEGCACEQKRFRKLFFRVKRALIKRGALK